MATFLVLLRYGLIFRFHWNFQSKAICFFANSIYGLNPIMRLMIAEGKTDWLDFKTYTAINQKKKRALQFIGIIFE